MSISVSIIEDDDILRGHLVQLINDSNRCELAGSASNGAEAMAIITEDQTDVYVVDLGLPDIDGVELISLIKSSCPGARCLVLSTFGDTKHMKRSIRAGATGYLLKDMPGAALINNIVTLHNGESPVSPSLVKLLVQQVVTQVDGNNNNDFEKFELASRELEVMHFLIDGLSIFNIGDRLCISSHTVNQHLRSIYRKLDVHSRAMAVSTAIKHGFLEL